ncbi:Arc family DNA-binding protein [Comamonas suwonensis]|uniref:Arc family DNA-binding protein n=1 Tax=Comamonas suwonensis TaxID=2606214 RepID=UPI00145EDF35|nr:Arc family DNA-binding protein [Comamonas suwonensis]MBI1625180.1 Arc family DNA-binding protein [Comamonas suwonensis]
MEEKQAYPSDQADKVLVRMPDGMRDRLKHAAKTNNRTMNAEIVARLAASLVAGSTDLYEADLKTSMEIVRQEFEHEKRLARAQLLLSTYQDQASLVRRRLDREIQLVEHIEAQLAIATKHGDDTAPRIARELKDAQYWLERTQQEYELIQQEIASTKSELEHARQSLKNPNE